MAKREPMSKRIAKIIFEHCYVDTGLLQQSGLQTAASRRAAVAVMRCVSKEARRGDR